MSISGISNSSWQQAWQVKMQQRKQDFSQLGAALQGGDLASAQKAFTDMQSLQPSGQAQNSAGNSPGNNGSGYSNSTTQDLSQIASLLQGGGVDLASILMPADDTSTSGNSSPDPFAALLQALQSTGNEAGNLTGSQSPSVSTQSDMQSRQATRQQREQDFSQLGAALQSGDLASAQKTFADLQSLKLGDKDQNSAGHATASGANGANSISNAFASLGQTLNSGNLTDAQSALAKLQSAMQAHKGGHHHHHHSGGVAALYSNVSGQSTNTDTSSSTVNISV